MHIVHLLEHNSAKKERRMCQYCGEWPPTNADLDFKKEVERAVDEKRAKAKDKKAIREAPQHILEHEKASEEKRECSFCDLVPMPPSLYQYDVVGTGLKEYYEECLRGQKKRKNAVEKFLKKLFLLFRQKA